MTLATAASAEEKRRRDATESAPASSGGVVQDQFGWWLAFYVHDDRSVEWLGVSPTRNRAEEWARESEEAGR